MTSSNAETDFKLIIIFVILGWRPDPTTRYRAKAIEIPIEGLPLELPCGFVRTLGATTLGDKWYMIHRIISPPSAPRLEVITCIAT